MGRRQSENEFEERPLSQAEWKQVLGAFKWGLGDKGVRALHRHEGCLRQDNIGYNVLDLQAAMNQKFSLRKMPFMVAMRYDRKIWTRENFWFEGFGRSRVWRYVNLRIVLLCKRADA